MVNAERDAVAATGQAAIANEPGLRPPLAGLWRALDAVADPEVPVVSVHELGMVRGLEWDETDPATLIVRLTPTYSGCPATDVIRASITDALLAHGAPRVRVMMQLSPAWTTDWMTTDARRKLRDFGIAPPVGAARNGSVAISAIGGMRRQPADAIACPRCGSRHTECVARFGSTACKAHFRCLDCAEPFDYFKPF
jgi:ring-1,2-phenylacetyl-CoA epoxidase subunit PaaD